MVLIRGERRVKGPIILHPEGEEGEGEKGGEEFHLGEFALGG